MMTEDITLAESGFYWLEKNGVRVLVSMRLEDAGFANGFSTRLGGVSPFPSGDLNLAGFGEDSDENIFENRKRFLDVFEKNYELTSVWQVHGDGIKKVANASDVESTEEKADGIVSNLTGILAGVKTADCVPVLIGDPVSKSFAAVHAGWRGTSESIVAKAIGKLASEYDAIPEDLICAIGPAATCANYEIGPEVVERFNEEFEYADELFSPTQNGHAYVDLHRANREQAIRKGLKAENISVAPICTMDRVDLFFSYRVEKKTLGKTGRLMSVIGRIN